MSDFKVYKNPPKYMPTADPPRRENVKGAAVVMDWSGMARNPTADEVAHALRALARKIETGNLSNELPATQKVVLDKIVVKLISGI